MAANGRIRFGVIGAAGIIGKTHIGAIQANPELAELVAVADVNESRLKQVADELKVKAYTDYKQLCADPDIDAVMIATPHPLHPEQALEAFAHGKHVLTEKAMAGRLSEGIRMVEAAEKAGLKLGVCFQHRLSPRSRKAFELVETGKIGDLLRVVCEVTAYKSQYYYNSGAWRGTWSGEEGGVLVNQAPHPIDIMLKLTGMPKRVWAVNRTQYHDIEVEDTATAILEYPNGAQGMIHFNTVTVPGVNRTALYGTKGALELTGGEVRYWRFDPPVDVHVRQYAGPNIYGRPEWYEEPVELPEGKGDHAGLVRNFCLAILKDEPLVCPGTEGLRSLELANAMTLSSYTGRPVDLPLDPAEYDALMEKLKKAGKAAAHRPLQPSPIS